MKNKGIPHIIPRFYLEYFCNNTTNKITVYSKKKGPYPSTPYNIAKQRKYYSLEKVPYYHKDLADDVLTIIENGIKETHQQLVDGDLNISPVKKINYATFVWSDSVHNIILFCFEGQCEMTTLTLNQCFDFSKGKASFQKSRKQVQRKGILLSML
jgi:hypothetical protein